MKTKMMMKKRMKGSQMMMNANRNMCSFCMAACCAAILLAGCEHTEPSAAERADRASRHYTAAMAELQAGRIDAAIKGFEEVVKAEPGNGNAHFQLAALLEEAKKDYLGAIVHYRLYLMIRPQSDKAAVATDRMKGCETRYAAASMEKAGLESQLMSELGKVRKEHEQCGAKAAKLSEQLDAAGSKIAALEKELEMKKKMLASAEAISDDPSVAKAPRKSLRPTDAELLDDESDGGQLLSTKEIKTLRAMLDEEDKAVPSRPHIDAGDAGADESGNAPALSQNVSTNAPAGLDGMLSKKDKKPIRLVPETYTVEEGDTLMRISAKFYGTNRKWRDIREANKAIISSDGRVKTGQVIKLP